MATLTNPIGKQNIVDRFADYVVATANGSIVWHQGAKPFSEMPSSTFVFGAAGRAIGISGADIEGAQITAGTIRSVLEAETAAYTNMRNLKAVLFVTGGGGNNGSRPTAGIVFDQTDKAHLNTGFRTAIATPDNAGVTDGQLASAANLESYFNNLRAAYQTERDSTVTVQTDVCHASCHSSCHRSRGRR